MLTYTITHNIYPNQSFSVHISSQTKSIILQNPSYTNFIILQNPSMFREIEKKKKKHWNTNKIKTEHLNKNFEIQTLEFRGTQNRARWVFEGRERENVVTWAEVGADELTEGVGGARSLLGWVLLSTVPHAWDYEMSNTTGVWYKGWVSEKVKEVILCWFREVGEKSRRGKRWCKTLA